MENQQLNSEKNLALISEMIATTRNNISEDGFHFLLWGVLIVLCCIIQFVMIEYLELPNESNYVWLLMPFIGAPISMWYGAKKRKEQRVKTFVDEFYKYIWVGFAISMFTVIFVSNCYKHSPTAFIMIITGFAVFVSGIVFKYKPLIIGAFVFWLAALLFFFVKSDAYQLLVFAVSIILGYIIPGLLLRSQYKTQ